MWQTETAGPIFGIPYGYAMLPIKPGSAGVALPGIEADVVDQDGRPLGVGEKGVMRIKRPVPRADRDAVGRAGAVRRRLLAEDPRRLLRRRRRPHRRGRLRLVRRSGRRDHQDRRSPDRDDRGRDRVPAPPGRRRGRRDRRAGRAARRGHRGVRRPAGRPRAIGRAAPGAAPDGPARAGAGRGHQARVVRRDAARRPAAARSCGAS